MARAIKSLCGAVKATAIFVVRRPKDAAFVILAILFIFILWRLKRERSHARELAAKTEGLPPDTKQTVTVYRDRVITKWRNGPAKIAYREKYLPPEGHVEIITKENASDKPPEIIVKDWGFIARLGGGIVYDGKIQPMLDLKWFYWKRYSLTVGVTPAFGGMGVSAHISNYLPFQNMEILCLYSPIKRMDFHLVFGIRVNF